MLTKDQKHSTREENKAIKIQFIQEKLSYLDFR